MADSDNIDGDIPNTPWPGGDRCFPGVAHAYPLTGGCGLGGIYPPVYDHVITSGERELKHNRAKIRRMRKEINNLSASHERMKAGYTMAERQRRALDMMLDQERQLGRLYQQMAADYKVELDRTRNKLKEMEERYGKR